MPVGTERVWNWATECGIPKVIVVNAVDKQNAHFDEVLADARAHYGQRVFPLNIPINPGPGFNQVLDVLRSEVVTYEVSGRGKYKEEPATGEWKDKVEALHKELIELIAESDDTLLSRTPGLNPVSPFDGPGDSGGRGSYRVVETIMGQKRELTAVPRP